MCELLFLLEHVSVFPDFFLKDVSKVEHSLC